MITLKRLKLEDIEYFSKWWRDPVLRKLTSGVLKPISDQEIKKYFQEMLANKTEYHFLILLNQKKAIGHIAFRGRKDKSCETQIIIGEKKYWGKGYGTKAIKLGLGEISKHNYKKVYLEVRPENLRAIKAYKNCGFRPIGLKRYPKNKFLPVVLKMSLGPKSEDI
ncbi:GNAT family N-acetyltransferase [Patescibacteria group bacterium]|nr:GNAT family N-acetyltransferase [Patescibacteria group bacterium]